VCSSDLEIGPGAGDSPPVVPFAPASDGIRACLKLSA
jgi:hypothetical protein